MPPTRVEVSCRMFGQNLALGSTCCNQWFYTIANGHDHVAERFDACTVRYLSARWHDAERTIRPSVECVHQPFECAALCGIDRRITIARKRFAKVDQVGDMKMHDRVRVAVTWLLMNGSAQEFVETRISGCFLKNDEFCFCDRHALRLEQ